MPARVYSAELQGIDAVKVEVEVDVGGIEQRFQIVGLPDTAVNESRERVKAALKHSGFEIPRKKIVVNLAPAGIRKEGAAFDLPIAIGILLAEGHLEISSLKDFLIAGELALDGAVRTIPGVLSLATTAKEEGIRKMIVPRENAWEATLLEGIEVYGVANLAEAIRALTGEIPAYRHQAEIFPPPSYEVDFNEIRGLEHAKRALEIAAVGSHNVLMIGPPGAGKTMLAQRLSTIMPMLSREEALEITRIYSCVGMLGNHKGLLTERPFRAPHHTTSAAGLIGGGTYPRPGEISLAHTGVLFLDELPLFPRQLLSQLLAPMENGYVVISRATGSLRFLCRFQLVAAMNPCPCGYYLDDMKPCQCTSSQIRNYQNRIPGPLLDRLDIFLEVPRPDYRKFREDRGVEDSATIRERVLRARKFAQKRFSGERWVPNARLTPRMLKKYCALSTECERLLEASQRHYAFSGRAIHKIIRLARSIADMEESLEISPAHLSEAISLRISRYFQ
ncbi:MAG: YifB family Mg chelatase-like AAA ATPase [bacterium JZ-2024 1]